MKRAAAIRDIVSEFGPKDPVIDADPTSLPLALPSFGKIEVEEAIDALYFSLKEIGLRILEPSMQYPSIQVLQHFWLCYQL